VTSTEDSLIAALTTFLEDAIAARDPYRGGGTPTQPVLGVDAASTVLWQRFLANG